jgi:hypothetical protein
MEQVFAALKTEYEVVCLFYCIKVNNPIIKRNLGKNPRT